MLLVFPVSFSFLPPPSLSLSFRRHAAECIRHALRSSLEKHIILIKRAIDRDDLIAGVGGFFRQSGNESAWCIDSLQGFSELMKWFLVCVGRVK